ncbi:hypothetical protein TDB9533_04670 [Thalassocella blandensis]|nr:hypothetical protein TDB9533_04670 [Thalassocella blandensis]
MSDEKIRIGRRDTLKLIASTAALPLVGYSDGTLAKDGAQKSPSVKRSVPHKGPTGSLSDPDLHHPNIAWDMVLSQEELAILQQMCNLIIPEDSKSPSAGSLGAHHYINEYVSAPYEWCQQDCITVRGGLIWINSESQRRYDKSFLALKESQQKAIFDDISWEETAKAEFRSPARFFAKVRDLTATAFYSTEQGMADIGFIGNKPMANFDGPPEEILKKLKLI